MTDLLRAGRTFTLKFRSLTSFLLIGLATSAILLAGCSDSLVAPDAAQEEALSAAAAAPMSARGSWNNWHVHDLPYGAEWYTDETGLRHEDYNIFPVIWPDYPSEASPVVYCIDGAEKDLVGGDGGSKYAAGTCRNDLYIIQIQRNASDAPAPTEGSGWTALPVGDGSILYYRLTPR
jgi:hypothetical protein